MMKLQFKFRETTAQADRIKVFNNLDKHGAINVRPLFPDADDAELAALYVVDYKDELAGQQLLKLLNASTAVEFAEREARRKLIRH